MIPTSLSDLELDLDVFLGPFDLLLSLILRDELDILEVDLADVVLAYMDHLDQRDELDLEATTEFLVLIAILLELKSRLLLPGEEIAELDELVPVQAATELLERIVRYARFRGAGIWAKSAHEQGQKRLFRTVAPPKHLRSAQAAELTEVQDDARLGKAIGNLLRLPAAVHIGHIAIQRVSLADRVSRLRRLLRNGSFSFDDALETDDRVTVAVTLYALLELYKNGEADWTQTEAFGQIEVTTVSAGAAAVSDGLTEPRRSNRFKSDSSPQ